MRSECGFDGANVQVADEPTKQSINQPSYQPVDQNTRLIDLYQNHSSNIIPLPRQWQVDGLMRHRHGEQTFIVIKYMTVKIHM
jgi:hypothetical protein